MSRVEVRAGRAGRRAMLGWVAAAVGAAVPAVPAVADSNYVGGAGVGSWSVAGNWSPVGVPGAGSFVNFVNADGLNRVLNYDYAGAPITLGPLKIDQTGQGTNTLSMGDFTLTDGGTTVGYRGRGTFEQSAGTHTTTSLVLGSQAGSHGTYTLGGGLLVGGATIGSFGDGAFVLNGGTHRASSLTVGNWGTGSYALNGGSLEVSGNEYLSMNTGSSGTFTQTGGSHTVGGSMNLGYAASGSESTPRFALSGGSLAVSGKETIGVNESTAVFEQTGGTHTADTLYVGDGAIGTNMAGGTYTLSGSGSLTTSSERIGGIFDGRGTFDQRGGTHTAANLAVSSRGRYLLSAGSLGAGYLTVGGHTPETGLFRQTGGSTTVGTYVSIASGTNQASTLELTGGTFAAPNAYVGGSDRYLGAGPGTLSVGGGAMTVPGVLKLWNDPSGAGSWGGSLNVSGGSLTVGTLQNEHVVTATGGTFTGALVNSGTVRASTGAVLTVTGGILQSDAPGAIFTPGRLVVESGASVVANFVRQGWVEINGGGASPAVLAMRRKADGGDTSVVTKSLAIQTDSQGAPLGRVDLADTALVINYAGAAGSPIGTIRGLLAAGRAGGAWSGNGLTSSVAAASGGVGALGYGEASVVVSPTGGVFEGQNVGGMAVVLRYTVAGDATMDGTVNFDDLLAVAKNYLGTDAYWTQGDFDYDGVVNFGDLLVLAKNYNAGAPAAVPGASAAFEADVAAAFAQAVPEPGVVGVLGVAMAGVVGRRRRR